MTQTTNLTIQIRDALADELWRQKEEGGHEVEFPDSNRRFALLDGCVDLDGFARAVETALSSHMTANFRAGYEAGKRDAIDRCLIERMPTHRSADDRTHNVAVNLCIAAIRALDWRHAVPTKEVRSHD